MAKQDITEASQSYEMLTHITGKDERAMLAQVDSWLNTCKQNRLQFERNWYLNLSFYFGKQWVQWVSAGTPNLSRLHVPKAPPWRVRLVSNKIKPIIRAELAKLTKEKPQPYVVPASSDEEDVSAARAAEQIFEHHIRELNLNRELRRSLFWMVLCGSSFIKDWFDPEKMDITPDGEPIKGKISLEKVSPFHLYVPEVQEEDVEDQPYIIHSVAKPVEWVKDRYKDKSNGINVDATGGSDILQQKFFSALGLTNSAKNLVVVNEVWIKPTNKYPDGAVITWANGKILSKTDGWPYEHKEFPFTKFDHIPTGRFYGESVIEDLIPLQKEYNRTRSQIIEAKNRMAKPQLLAQKGSIDPNKMTSEPGLIVLYNLGYNEPRPIPLIPLPNYVIEELERSQRDMDDISAQHEVTKGRTPPGVTAATAISYLQEEDDSKLSATVSSIEEGTEKIGRHLLSYVKQYWDLPRVIKTVGFDGAYESYNFTKSSIKGNTDLRIESGSATPRSRAAKQAFIMELGKMEWIPPDRALRYLDMSETAKMYEEMHIDSRQAQRENIKMSEGEQVPVNDWDNHEEHIAEHNNFRKRQKFEMLPEEFQAIFQAHVDMHKQLATQNMGQLAPPGAPLPPEMNGQGPPQPGGGNGAPEPTTGVGPGTRTDM